MALFLTPEVNQSADLFSVKDVSPTPQQNPVNEPKPDPTPILLSSLDSQTTDSIETEKQISAKRKRKCPQTHRAIVHKTIAEESTDADERIELQTAKRPKQEDGQNGSDASLHQANYVSPTQEFGMIDYTNRIFILFYLKMTTNGIRRPRL